MKKFALFAASVSVVLALIGCDHSTNTQPVPIESGISITAPSQDSYVQGSVEIAATVKDVGERYVDFYVDGRLITRSSTAPWTCTWNTSGLAANSSHTLTAIAITDVNTYTTSAPVVVKIR
ncbi:MAG: Ig-like domain-containing protein [Ignavibacteriae bacterium]|nr:Ig-like domain-containing protein [Ignavibacteriota bacterium]